MQRPDVDVGGAAAFAAHEMLPIAPRHWSTVQVDFELSGAQDLKPHGFGFLIEELWFADVGKLFFI